MNYNSQHKPLKLNMDKDEKHLSEDEAFFLLNHERNTNGGNNSLGKTTPMPANYALCELEKPAGETYVVGRPYYSPLTGETYSFTYNSNGVHFISRISDKGCEIVYHGPCLEGRILPEPQHAVEDFRVFLKYDKTCKNQHGKQLIWTTGKGGINQLDVEASIATNFFTTPFFDRCTDGCEILDQEVPNICGCVRGDFVPLKPDELSLSNKILDAGFKFMVKHEYYDGRMSLWSDASPTYYQDSKGCFDTSNGFPRCINLRIPIGNPLVERIHIAYHKGDVKEGRNVWYLYDVIEKYKQYNSSQQYWYERGMAELPGYSDIDCAFDYLFCNEKQCAEIDRDEILRIYNPAPRDAQGIIPIDDSIGVYNYVQGTCPIDKVEVQKFKIEQICKDIVECTPKMCKVKVRAIIHNFGHDKNQFVYRMGGGSVDDVADTARFGGLNSGESIITVGGGLEIGYDQEFSGNTRNFIVYAEGTEYWAEMKQYKADKNWRNRSATPHGLVFDMGSNDTTRKQNRFIKGGGFYYQEAEILVPQGTRGFFRLASHHAQSGSGANQDTSTFVVGILNNLSEYRGDNISPFNSETEEIYFDTCGKDSLDITQAFVIQDNAVDSGLFATRASAYHGYIKDHLGRPIEGAIIQATDGVNYVSTALSSRTDHNGFFHLYIEPNPSLFIGPQSGLLTALLKDNADVTFAVQMEQTSGGAFKNVYPFTIQGGSGLNIGSNQELPKNDDYDDDFYCTVRTRVVDCGGVGVIGVRVALSGSKYEVTKESGLVEWRVRNYPHRNRVVRYVVLDPKGCFSLTCDEECNPCMPTQTYALPATFYFKPTSVVPTSQINKESSGLKRGLKNGGRYEFAIQAKGRGKISSPYSIGFIDVARAQEKGKVQYCSFSYSALGMQLPEWVECLEILRTKNLNNYLLQWVVDKWERTTGGKLKLTIQSLNGYNAEYIFKTNTVYQYLKGDRVEFIRNGDGEVFDTATHGVLNFMTLSPSHDRVISGLEEAPADFFNQLLIDDDGKLDDLKPGAIIEIQRPQECITEPTFYGICASISALDGSLLYQSGTFDTFDTYQVTRKIGTLPLSTFEHHSPSDFWGDHLDDTGKGYVVNRYENERRYGRNITINAANQYNWYGDLVKTFEAPEQGDITAIGIKDGKILLVVCEHDNFLAQVADDLVRVGQDGAIHALPPDAIVSSPQAKVSGRYGCQYPHIGSIYFGDGWAVWWDVENHTYVRHDYSKAEPVSDGIVQSYIRRRSQQFENTNRNTQDPLSQFRFITGYNRHTGAVQITMKTLRDSAINNEKEPYKRQNETLLFHPATGDFLTFASWTPEAYAHTNIFDGSGCAFVSYMQGEPYIHPVVSENWNEFFGVPVDRVIGIALNKYPEKKKIALAIEMQSSSLWYAHSVKTDTEGFESEIPAIKWKRERGKINAPFLNNKNRRGGIHGNPNGISEGARGYFVSCVFVRDNTDSLKYGTIDNSKRTKYDEVDLILFKFALSEQSGYTENL